MNRVNHADFLVPAVLSVPRCSDVSIHVSVTGFDQIIRIGEFVGVLLHTVRHVGLLFPPLCNSLSSFAKLDGCGVGRSKL